jgi:hypothetical protein
MSWREALELLAAELGEPVTFRVEAERQFLERLTGAGVPAGEAELLITREWAILAGENDYTTGPSSRSPATLRAQSPISFTTTARNTSDLRAPSSPDVGIPRFDQLGGRVRAQHRLGSAAPGVP